MKKRPNLGIERLEARETPDVSLGHAALGPIPPFAVGVVSAANNLLQPAAELSAWAAASLPPDAGIARNPSHWQALQALIADSSELEKLLTGSAELLPGKQNTPAAGPAPDATQQGWQFLSNYTRKAIRNAETRYGTLADHEDILHDAFVAWRQAVGPSDQVFARLLDADSSERQVLRTTVRRVIDHARYEQRKQNRMVELLDQPAPAKAGDQEWIDLQIDWSQGAAGLSPRQQQLLALRREGKTFEEIGTELGLVKQRACEMYTSAVENLRDLYSV